MRHRIRPRGTALATALSATMALASMPAHASCEVTIAVDFCTLAWLAGDDFWDGSYRVEYGHGVMTANGQPIPLPFTGGGGVASIDQSGASLAISHPQRFLQASASEVALDTPEWQWAEQAESWFTSNDAAEFATMQAGVAFWARQQCTNQEMPRWSAPTHSADNQPMTLDLVGVGPLVIMGLLHAQASQQGMRLLWMQEVIFTRDDFPRSELDSQTIDDDAVCSQVCDGSGDWVRYNDGYIWCAQ